MDFLHGPDACGLYLLIKTSSLRFWDCSYFTFCCALTCLCVLGLTCLIPYNAQLTSVINAHGLLCSWDHSSLSRLQILHFCLVSLEQLTPEFVSCLNPMHVFSIPEQLLNLLWCWFQWIPNAFRLFPLDYIISFIHMPGNKFDNKMT